DKFKLFCWILNTSSPFPVLIEKGETVDDLKKAIKKELEHALVGIDTNRLDIWKLQRNQSPQEIAGCVELDPLDELSEHFSSPPRKHLHIVVQLPPPP
ncbi:hypothetical protein L208DRAFT_1402812, partial [Tricholoma matsutake]